MNAPAQAVCKWCVEPGYKIQGSILLCAKHYRMQTMRTRAKRDGKVVPSYELLERLSVNMVCVKCKRTMTWLRTLGVSQQASLQHDHSGEIKIICLGCNSSHRHNPNDSFYSIPDDHKFCKHCKLVLPLNRFHKDSHNSTGVTSHCRKCNTIKHGEWSRKNADHIRVWRVQWLKRRGVFQTSGCVE